MIVLKIGGSLITDRQSSEPRINAVNLKRICREIGDAYKQSKSLFIVHGAGSYGHAIVKKTGIDAGISQDNQLVALAETQRLQNELNCLVVGELIKNGVPAFPFQCSSHAIMKNKKLESMQIDAVKGLMSLGMVPVAFGVPAYDSEQGCSILSGDVIAPFFAKELKASLIIHATDVDGVFDADPKIKKTAKIIPRILMKDIGKMKKSLAGSKVTDVTGGMASKVRELGSAGVDALIINGTKPNLIKMALLGKTTEGTLVKA